MKKTSLIWINLSQNLLANPRKKDASIEIHMIQLAKLRYNDVIIM